MCSSAPRATASAGCQYKLQIYSKGRRYYSAVEERSKDMADIAAEYRYNRLMWEEMNEAIAIQKVVILPTGSTEQHGPHLPLDTDVFLAETICLAAAQ